VHVCDTSSWVIKVWSETEVPSCIQDQRRSRFLAFYVDRLHPSTTSQKKDHKQSSPRQGFCRKKKIGSESEKRKVKRSSVTISGRSKKDYISGHMMRAFITCVKRRAPDTPHYIHWASLHIDRHSAPIICIRTATFTTLLKWACLGTRVSVSDLLIDPAELPLSPRKVLELSDQTLFDCPHKIGRQDDLHVVMTLFAANQPVGLIW